MSPAWSSNTATVSTRHDRKRVQVGGGGQGDDSNPGEMYTHMTLLSETTEGMHNLFRLSSLASLEGYYYKPRMDRELLETYGKGIIATTGCPSGEVQRLLLARSLGLTIVTNNRREFDRMPGLRVENWV